VSQTSQRLAALERIQPLLDRPPVQLDEPRPSRDELHERPRISEDFDAPLPPEIQSAFEGRQGQ
jgi:hypothetical protein